MATSARKVRRALYSLLIADSPFMTFMGVPTAKPYAVFNGLAAQGTVLPYLVLGSITENKFPMFKKEKRGNSTVETFHFWSGKAGDDEILASCEHLDRLLSGVRITVPTLAVVQGDVRLIATFPEEEQGRLVMHGLIQYEYLAFP